MPVYILEHLVCKIWKTNLAFARGLVRGNGSYREGRQRRTDFVACSSVKRKALARTRCGRSDELTLGQQLK